MKKRIAKKNLSQEEASYVKAMLKYTKMNKQQILSYFIKPGYDVNQRVITQIARGDIHENIEPTSKLEMDKYIQQKTTPLHKDDIDVFCENLRINDNIIDISENKNIEYKKSFTERFDNLLKPILGFSNSIGGYIMYGISDQKIVIGLNEAQEEKFGKFDLKRLNEQILSVASSEITVLTKLKIINGKKIGIIQVLPAERKPIISICNKGSDISTGKIYYRYNAETKEIMASELEKIIEERTEIRIKNDVMKLLSTILKNGIDNNVILNSKTGEMDLGGKKTFILDEQLLEKINFIKNGKLTDSGGSPVYSVVGEVSPLKIEEVVVKKDVYDTHDKTLSSAVNEINSEIKKIFTTKLKINNDIVKKILKIENKYNLWGYHQEEKHGRNTLHCLSEKAVNFIFEKLKSKDNGKEALNQYIETIKQYQGTNNEQ